MAEKALLLDTINPAAAEVFTEAGFEVEVFPKSEPEAALMQKIEDAQILGVRSGPRVSGELLDAGKELLAVGCFCVGTNHVDLGAASHNGVAVFNSVHENTRSVAEHVISNVFNLMKRIPEHNMSLHEGLWTKTDKGTHEVRGKTIGIVGYGAVGSQVSVLAESIGMDVVYFDPSPKLPPYGKAHRVEQLDALLEQSDVVTLHVPGGASTQNLIDEARIARMKPGSLLINTARGEVVDYEAVVAAIDSGQLGGVAADVFEDEPSNTGDEFNHILRGVAKAVLTPHTAGSTQEAQREIGSETAKKLLGYLATGSSGGSVNLPEIGMPPLAEGTTRILNIHGNVPGVLSRIDGVLSDMRLNILRTFHDTKRDIGYVAQDVDRRVDETDLQSIAEDLQTFRVRTITA